ncbi:hypothetical protein TNCV_1689611 [Trichonephila clavipes]|nr:hypothetical protein TNCV_1689611 [Trichonephila clavipes]
MSLKVLTRRGVDVWVVRCRVRYRPRYLALAPNYEGGQNSLQCPFKIFSKYGCSLLCFQKCRIYLHLDEDVCVIPLDEQRRRSSSNAWKSQK